MHQLEDYFSQLIDGQVYKLIISKPRSKSEEFKKIVIEKKEKYYQIAKYTDKQVFHENVEKADMVSRCFSLTDGHFGQVNAWSLEWEYYILISKKGSATLKRNKTKTNQAVSTATHNRKKNYILEEGTPRQVFDNPQHRRTQEFLGEVL